MELVRRRRHRELRFLRRRIEARCHRELLVLLLNDLQNSIHSIHCTIH